MPRFALDRVSNSSATSRLLLIAACATVSFTTLSTRAYGQAEPAAPTPEATPATPDAASATPDAAPATPDAAPPADAAAPQAAAVAGSTNVKADVEDFWHFAKIARYDAANAKAQAIIAANAAPGDVLAAFEAAAGSRKGDDLTAGMVRFEGVPELKESATALEKILVEGRYGRRADAKFIESNIQRLITNQIGYSNGLNNLRNSGEMAVPLLLEYLRSPERAQYHDAARRALKDLGRVTLNPLVAATETSDANTLNDVITILGDLGYNDVAPYLLKVRDSAQSANIKESAGRALAKLGATGAADAAFYDLAEKLYYGKSAIVSDNRNPTAFVWYWTEANGLQRKEVPSNVYGQIMAMRASEYALGLAGTSSAEISDRAMSLWLAANYKRQVDLAGAADPTRAENQPNAHYYGVTSGPKYLGAALKRALDDRDSAVAFEIIRSAQDIIGTSTLDVTREGGSLVQALGYSDRKVRFEAAFALAAAKPAAPFSGSDSVVPLLGEALSQTGKATALILAGSTDKANAIADPLKAAGYDVVATTTATDAGAAAQNLAAVDVVVFDGTLPADQVEGIVSQLTTAPKLRGSARLAMVQTSQSPFEEMKVRDPLLSTTTETEPAAVKAAVDAARAKAGALPIDPAIATDYSLRAATLLERVGNAGAGGVYDIANAKPTLLKSLDDARPEIVVAVGKVLAQLNHADAQGTLLAKASAAETPAELRIATYKALASNAKQFGNKLDAGAVAILEKVVTDEADLNIRNAAAEARGALNLSADQAKTIILKQSVK